MSFSFFKSRWTSKALDAAAIHKSAVHPLFWTLVVIGGGCLTGMAKMPSPFNGICAAVFVVLVIAFLAAYFFFMFTDPDRLHSEEFQSRARALEMIAAKGGPISLNPIDLEAIANPQHLPAPEDSRGPHNG